MPSLISSRRIFLSAKTNFFLFCHIIYIKKIVEGNDYHAAEIYEGTLDENTVISRLLEVYHDHLHPLAEVGPYILSDDFLEKVCKYLKAAKVLVSENSDMEEIIYQRDINYAEDNEVQKCIDAIKTIRKV